MDEKTRVHEALPKDIRRWAPWRWKKKHQLGFVFVLVIVGCAALAVGFEIWFEVTYLE